MFATLEMPFSALPDERLAGLFAATRLWYPNAEALATCVGCGVIAEARRREHNRSVSVYDDAIPPDLLQVNFARWSDRDVGEALALLSVFSRRAESADFGELSDSLLDMMAQEAARRMVNSGDYRNGSTFGQRLKGEDDAPSPN